MWGPLEARWSPRCLVEMALPLLPQRVSLKDTQPVTTFFSFLLCNLELSSRKESLLFVGYCVSRLVNYFLSLSLLYSCLFSSSLFLLPSLLIMHTLFPSFSLSHYCPHSVSQSITISDFPLHSQTIRSLLGGMLVMDVWECPLTSVMVQRCALPFPVPFLAAYTMCQTCLVRVGTPF